MTALEPPLTPLTTTTNGTLPINGNGNGILHDNLADPSISFDSSVFRSYLLALLPPVVGASLEELESLFDDEFDDRVSRFAGEGGGVIYVSKKRDEVEGEQSLDQLQYGDLYRAEDVPPTYTYKLTPQLTYDSSHVTTLAIIKRGPTLDSTSPLATQLHILNLFGGDETPYESLHAVVSCAVKPWFEAFVGARGGGKEGDSKMG